MSLFWRIFGLNALVLGTATALLLWAPVTVSVPVLLTEAVILVGGLAVMLVANAALLRWGLAPLGRLTRLMATVDLLRPGQRLPVPGPGARPDAGHAPGRGAGPGDRAGGGGGEVTELIRTFNAMLDRLEHERATSSARVLLAQEAERRRIAQELHDEVGQSMTAILLVLGRAADEAAEPLRAELRQAQEITRDSLDEVRRLVRRLRPGVLDDLGLVSALTSLTEDFAVHTGLYVARRFDADLPALPPETELVLYRVAQESLTNVARHADARRVEVRLCRTGGTVVLEVTDDGRGVEAVCEGAGIRGMRERALLAGAVLTLASPPGSGTRVRLTVPVPAPGTPPAAPAPAVSSSVPLPGSPDHDRPRPAS
ncbi:sensor histidine kinase [Streptomyces griseoviridis]|uniref:histidine kinase n=1 Tax=Streptomyces griseoviridis TaxID=45398 RepID=A0ABT9LAD6_STRGD|nr:sensor histidine kinase [Streptomyces griseoviridis]MDP9680665.1 two-component system sensor histidine kinase UhpB [Streptomyces griseoviridis]GGS98631.1 histidine kinase [Streptomyces griseoviridis]